MDNIQAYSFVTVYCAKIIIFLCVTRKLFSLRKLGVSTVSCPSSHQIVATPLLGGAAKLQTAPGAPDNPRYAADCYV